MPVIKKTIDPTILQNSIQARRASDITALGVSGNRTLCRAVTECPPGTCDEGEAPWSVDGLICALVNNPACVDFLAECCCLPEVEPECRCQMCFGGDAIRCCLYDSDNLIGVPRAELEITALAGPYDGYDSSTGLSSDNTCRCLEDIDYIDDYNRLRLSYFTGFAPSNCSDAEPPTNVLVNEYRWFPSVFSSTFGLQNPLPGEASGPDCNHDIIFNFTNLTCEKVIDLGTTLSICEEPTPCFNRFGSIRCLLDFTPASPTVPASVFASLAPGTACDRADAGFWVLRNMFLPFFRMRCRAGGNFLTTNWIDDDGGVANSGIEWTPFVIFFSAIYTGTSSMTRPPNLTCCYGSPITAGTPATGIGNDFNGKVEYDVWRPDDVDRLNTDCCFGDKVWNETDMCPFGVVYEFEDPPDPPDDCVSPTDWTFDSFASSVSQSWTWTSLRNATGLSGCCLVRTNPPITFEPFTGTDWCARIGNAVDAVTPVFGEQGCCHYCEDYAAFCPET